LYKNRAILNINPKIPAIKPQNITVENLTNQIIEGNKVALAQGITRIESTNPQHIAFANELITKILPHTGKSIRIGITGVPGVGKSTFIESFGTYCTDILQKKVAVLAIDPSSSVSKGSILGDKTRMETLVKNNLAFVRPSPSGTTLGGVAKNTREAILLCEAAGFEIVIIETVGVGQSETLVKGMVDFFLLLNITGAGDELQGIKRGIMEMADGIIINKADGDNAKKAIFAQKELERALHYFPVNPSGWIPKVLTYSSLNYEKATDVWKMITEFVETTQANQYFFKNRNQQNQVWFTETLKEGVLQRFYADETIQNAVEIELEQIKNNQISPFTAAKNILDGWVKPN
jgi:LAO/AO transport system kinase